MVLEMDVNFNFGELTAGDWELIKDKLRNSKRIFALSAMRHKLTLEEWHIYLNERSVYASAIVSKINHGDMINEAHVKFIVDIIASSVRDLLRTSNFVSYGMIGHMQQWIDTNGVNITRMITNMSHYESEDVYKFYCTTRNR